MIPVPSRQLIVAVGSTASLGLVAPVLGLGGELGLLVGGGLALVAGVDLLLGWILRQPPASRMDRVHRLSRERKGEVALILEKGRRPQRVRVGLSLGEHFSLPSDEAWVELPAGEGGHLTTWECTGRSRGHFREATVALQADSPLLLWQLRCVRRVEADVRVYPNLFAEKKPLAAVFLARNQVGSRMQRTIGRGREFEKLRDYLPGDGFDEIHWKASAKRNRPITKVFQSERTQEIYVVIDSSRLSGRSVVHEGREQPLLERFLAASMLLLLAAERQGDRFGLVVFDDRIRTFLAAGQGDGHYGACREAAAGVRPGEATPDIAELVRCLRTRLRRRALVFVLTDLSDPVVAEDFARHAGPLARQHLVLLSQIPPAEVAPLFHGPEARTIEDVYARVAGHARWQEILTVQRKLKASGVRAMTVRHENLAAELVAQYIEVKQRQVL
ncbi:MAG: DUF58 domain-containing protein [Opitutaceae bacterium]|nr:DUF58 domain-containing protein [Opitutaceae bacterium]